MAQVLVRDVDPEILEKLRARAQQNHRSLEAELRVIFAQVLQQAEPDRWVEVERVRTLFAGRQFSDSAALLREDRDQ